MNKVTVTFFCADRIAGWVAEELRNTFPKKEGVVGCCVESIKEMPKEELIKFLDTNTRFITDIDMNRIHSFFFHEEAIILEEIKEKILKEDEVEKEG